jgi:acetoin utilization protein AcuB
MHSIMIKDYMIRYPYIVSPDLSVQDAADYMSEMSIRHLPVVANERLKGIVSEREVKAALATDNPALLRVADVMKTDVYIAHPKEALSDVVNDMASEKVGSVIVVDDAHQVLGIFTTTDALKILADRMGELEDEQEDLDLIESYEDRFIWAN